MLLCFPLVNELLLYMYLSQLMSTFTKLSKSALSSRWYLHPESQEPVIQQSHMYLLIHWLVNQEYIGQITGESQSEYLSVCPVLISISI